MSVFTPMIPTLNPWNPVTIVSDFWYNAVYHTLSPSQKQQGIVNEATGLVRASGGIMSMDEAMRIASGDQTSSLKSNNADPSQASGFDLFKSTPVLVLIVSAVAAVLIWKAVRNL